MACGVRDGSLGRLPITQERDAAWRLHAVVHVNVGARCERGCRAVVKARRDKASGGAGAAGAGTREASHWPGPARFRSSLARRCRRCVPRWPLMALANGFLSALVEQGRKNCFSLRI